MKAIMSLTLLGLLSLAACGAPAASPQNGPSPQARPAVATQVDDTGPISPVPPPTTEPTATAVPQRSPLPTPTAEPAEPAATPPSSASQTPIIQEGKTESQASDKLEQRLGDAVLIFQRSGGFAGLDEQWTIYPDGRITLNNGREWQVSATQVNQLLTDIETLGFFELSNRYVPLDTCCDRFTYNLTARQGDKVNTVVTIDDAPTAPDQLWQALEKVNSLLNNLQ